MRPPSDDLRLVLESYKTSRRLMRRIHTLCPIYDHPRWVTGVYMMPFAGGHMKVRALSYATSPRGIVASLSSLCPENVDEIIRRFV